jgi:hypothetical protein
MKRRALKRRYGRSHVEPGPLVEGNVYWESIPKSARVIERTHGWIVKFADGRQATAYWDGRNAIAAQRWLRARAIKDARRS